jgi:hypothetical protein
LKNKIENVRILTILIVFLTSINLSSQISGFSNFVYVPEYGTFDNIEKKGDINVQIASGALNNIDFPSFRASFGVYENIVIGANLFSFGSSSPNISAQVTKAYLVSGDIGLFKEINLEGNKKFRLHTTLSYGQGMVSREFLNFTGELNLGIQRYSLVGGAMLKLNKKVNFGLGLTSKFFNYSDKGGIGDVTRADRENFGELIGMSPTFLLDLNSRIEFGDDFAKLFFNWDFVLKNFNNKDNNLTDLLAQEAIHIGFNIVINKAINNIKIKRNEKI